MAYFFTLTLLCSLVLLIIGFFNPAKALFWKKTNREKKQSIMVYSMGMLISLAGIGVTAPDIAGDKNKPGISTDGQTLSETSEQIKNNARKELGKDCDTSYVYIDSAMNVDHDTGYIVLNEIYHGVFEENGKLLPREKWAVDIFEQTGPDVFKKKGTKPVEEFPKVRIEDAFLEERNNNSWAGYFVVSPLGSSEKFIINIDNFSLKDFSRCRLLSKIKNHIITKAIYMIPGDAAKRPVTDGAEREWIDVPEDATIIITGSNRYNGLINARVFDQSGKFVARGDFDISTLGETD